MGMSSFTITWMTVLYSPMTRIDSTCTLQLDLARLSQFVLAPARCNRNLNIYLLLLSKMREKGIASSGREPGRGRQIVIEL